MRGTLMDQRETTIAEELVREALETQRHSWHNRIELMLECYYDEATQERSEYNKLLKLYAAPMFIVGGDTWLEFSRAIDREPFENALWNVLEQDFEKFSDEPLEMKEAVVLITHDERLKKDTAYPVVLRINSHEPNLFIVMNENPDCMRDTRRK